MAQKDCLQNNDFTKLSPLSGLSKRLLKIHEDLSLMDMRDYYEQLELYPDLERLFSTCVLDLDPIYKRLVSIETCKLFPITLNHTILKPLSDTESTVCFMASINGKMMGFAFYTHDVFKDSIVNLGLLPLNMDSSKYFIKSVKCMIDDLRKVYKMVRWESYQRNEHEHKLYKKITKKHHGFYKEFNDGIDSKYIYFIPGTEPLLDSLKTYLKEDFSR